MKKLLLLSMLMVASQALALDVWDADERAELDREYNSPGEYESYGASPMYQEYQQWHDNFEAQYPEYNAED